MTPTAHARRLARCIGFSRLAGVLVTVVGLLALAGWTFDVEALRSGVPGFTAMNPGGTALALLLSGAALWLLAHGPAADRRHVVGQILAALVVLISAARLAGYFFAWDGGPDRWLFAGQLLLEEARLGHPNRMAPNTAAGLLFAGLALLLPDTRVRGRSVASLPALAAALIALLGHVLRFPRQD